MKTLSKSDHHHLYQDSDEEKIRLKLKGCEFEAKPNEIDVSIPVELWEVIRLCTAANLDLVDLSDDEIRDLARKDADAHCAAQNADPENNLIPDPEMTFEIALKYFTEKRTTQQKVRAKIGYLKE